MNDRDTLVDEAELRRLLRQPAGSGTDTAFEAAVLNRIRREKRQSALLLAGVAASAAVLLLLGLWALAVALSPAASICANLLAPFVDALKPLANTAGVWIECAFPAMPGDWPHLAALELCLAILALTILILLEISLCRLLCRPFGLQTK